jgi:hypothetical protein
MGKESDEDAKEKQPIPTFREAVPALMQWYLTSFTIDDTSTE